EKLKVRGSPKRALKQTCSFNKSHAGRVLITEKQAIKVRRKKRKLQQKELTLKTLKDESNSSEEESENDSNNCSVCHMSLVKAGKLNITSTNCCLQRMHRKCLRLDACPDCDEL